MTNPKRILLIRTDRIGDVLLSTPAIRAVREAYPDGFIAMMVRPYAYPVVQNNPHLDEVIVYDKYGKDKSIHSTIRFAFSLKKKHFDQALILHATNRAHWISFLAGIGERIGFSRRVSYLLTRAVGDKKHLGEKHEVQYTLDLIRNAGIALRGDFDWRKLDFFIGDRDRDWIRNYLSETGIKGEELIVINPLASCPSKIWPPERFAQVAEDLRNKYGQAIKIISLKKDERFSIGQLAALLERSALLISNDSGPVHIATAAGTPVVDIFGRSDPGLSPVRWGPLGDDDIVLHKDVGCKKCLAHRCDKDFQCLKAITVEEVFNAAVKILEKSRW